MIDAILGGADALVVMPTGGGKSLCYQLPALILEGTTVVVSPLIALMKDQVDALQRRGIAATLINSSLRLAEQQERIRALARGEFKLVYIAPERFRSRSFRRSAGTSDDRAFRRGRSALPLDVGPRFPARLFSARTVVLEKLGRPQVAAFTATATPEVRRDILTHLGLARAAGIRGGIRAAEFEIAHYAGRERSAKIRAAARADSRKQDRHRLLLDPEARGSRRRNAARCAKISSILYHGGMNDEERERAQNEFMKGERDIVVATNAFGMGIDRSDIRFVVHFEVPGSVEAYYQEAGRAGRDGEAATCELFFNHADTRVQEFFIEGSNPPPEFIVADLRDAAARGGRKTRTANFDQGNGERG